MFSFAGIVDIGVYEQQNDDRLLIGSHLLIDGEFSGKTDHPYIVAAICDGVGGLAQGYRAAMSTLEVFSHFDRSGVTAGGIKDAIETANTRIRNAQSLENLQKGMRTTIAGIYADENRMYVFNAGDSRVYRFRYRYFTQLSKDHSLVAELLDAGIITEDEGLELLSTYFSLYAPFEGQLHQSLRQSSYDIWLNFMNGDDNARDVRINYYFKGPVIGLLMDIDIRRKTNGEHSLDDVMRLLYNRFYKELQRGFTEEEFWDVCQEVAGEPLSDIRHLVDTTTPIDYAAYLKDEGLEVDTTEWAIKRTSADKQEIDR